MILSIKWVHGVDTAKEASGKGRRMRVRLALEKEEVDEGPSYAKLMENGNGYDHPGPNSLIKESFVRGEGIGPLAEMSGLGTGSWWKAQDKRMTKSLKEVEAKVEERPDDEPPHREPVAVS